MRYIGVDLAWGQNGITGLAVLDEGGTLLDVTSGGSDEDILSWLSPWVEGSCLVAIDAPLIVNNPTGNRPCERLIGKHFGRCQASCHSANTAIVSFANGTRGLRIARALDLDIDPSSTAGRRAIEVYPHPAIVALFGLSRILRYKARTGRDLEFRRSELLRLIALLEGLSVAEVPLYAGLHSSWQRIGQEVRSASRKSELDRVEDSIDAVVCAYVAMYSHHKPSSVRVMGDLSSGYILTPVTPEIGLAFDAATCVFCDLLATGSLLASDPDAAAFAPLPDGLLAPGHTLVIPRQHSVGVHDAEPSQLAATMDLVQRVSQAMLDSLGASGVNVLNASGPGSGQSVPHLHFHVVPRWRRLPRSFHGVWWSRCCSFVRIVVAAGWQPVVLVHRRLRSIISGQLGTQPMLGQRSNWGHLWRFGCLVTGLDDRVAVGVVVFTCFQCDGVGRERAGVQGGGRPATTCSCGRCRCSMSTSMSARVPSASPCVLQAAAHHAS